MRALTTAVFVIAIAAIVAAQTGAPPRPPVDPNTRFEEASIKAVDGANTPVTFRMTPTRFDASVSVAVLLRFALQKPDYRIVGAPGWVNEQRYAIAGAVPKGTPAIAMAVMLVNLLKDRFQLATHVETRELPIFNLVKARADGRLGPDLKPTSAECLAEIAQRLAAQRADASPGGAAQRSFPEPGKPLSLCGSTGASPGLLYGRGRTIAQTVPALTDFVRRPVVDKTGLTGLYDLVLKFSPDTAAQVNPLGLPSNGPPPNVDPDAPGLFSALQEQLGLKLENDRAPVEVVVIDKLARPTLD